MHWPVVVRLTSRIQTNCRPRTACAILGRLARTAANLFLKPITVDRQGHENMLEFGLALATGETSFTFPLARNLRTATR